MDMDQITDEDIIKIAAKAGAEAALEKLEKERLKQVKGRNDKRLRNTKLLLRNYRMFKKHCTEAVYNASQLSEENAIDLLDLMWDPINNGEIFVESIKNSAIKTKIIMSHISDMMEIYKLYCERSLKQEDQRRCRIIFATYIEDKITTVDKIAEVECIDTRTVYKDIDAAIEKISALIFGIDFIR